MSCLFDCLSVTLVYCSQTVGWIKLTLVMEVGLGLGDVVLDGNPSPPPTESGTVAPHFSAHVYCGQTVANLSYCWALVLVILVTDRQTNIGEKHQLKVAEAMRLTRW